MQLSRLKRTFILIKTNNLSSLPCCEHGQSFYLLDSTNILYSKSKQGGTYLTAMEILVPPPFLPCINIREFCDILMLFFFLKNSSPNIEL